MNPIRYEIRAASRRDLDDLIELARFLDSVNLPNDPGAIEDILALSEASFSGEIADPRRREYVFVLYDHAERRAIGTSMIVAQLGRRDAPYIYFDVRTEERYSATLDRHFRHEVLQIGFSYDGPTEIGGLVMHPDYRLVPEKLGMQISYVRFLFIAMHRVLFRDELLAELLPPLEPDGTSHLWEAVGRHFTDLTYREADRLSKSNKEFIWSLFPHGEIYASVLPPNARSVIGEVGAQTRGVEKLLRRIGFEYAERVDPFDGGPHFVAATDRVLPVMRSAPREAELAEVTSHRHALVGIVASGEPAFRAVRSAYEASDRVVRLPASTMAHLGLVSGQEVWVLPLE